MQLPQEIPPDSVRAVLRDIFAARPYDWSAHRNPFAYLLALWRQLMDFLARLADQHPVGYWAVMLVLALIAIAMFTHIGVILKRALRPVRAAAAGPGILPTARDAAWHLAEAVRLAA